MIIASQTIQTRHRPRGLRLSILLLFMFFFGSWLGGAWAQEISFVATVNRKKVPLTGSVQLTLTVQGSQVARIDLPEIEGFQSQYSGPMTQFSLINGQAYQSQSHTYLLFPTQTGSFRIPSISVSIAGQVYSTEPIDIEVFDQPQPQSQYNPNQQDQTVSLEDRIFLEVEIPEKDFYLYEQIPVVIRLHVSQLSVGDIQYPVISKEGFRVDEFDKPSQHEDLRQGLRFEVLEFKTKIYPTRPGPLKFGPVQLDCSIQRERPRQRRTVFDEDFFGHNLFDDQLFNEFFGRVEKRPYKVQSTPLTVNVLPLPEEGKTADFSEAVGQFYFDMSLSPEEVNVGDPITVKMTVTGLGDFSQVQMPQYQENDLFKVYEPEIKEEKGRKFLQQVIIPKSDKLKAVPALSFTYFDPQNRMYQSNRRGPFPVSVKPSTQEPSLTVVRAENTTSVQTVDDVLGRDLVYIKTSPGRIYGKDYAFYKGPTIKWLYALVTLGFVLTLLGYQRYQKVRTDVAFARRLRAPKAARKGLSVARQFSQQNQPGKFYNQLFKTLQDYFGNKFHLPSQGLTYDQLATLCVEQKMDETHQNNLKNLFMVCDEVRFASATFDQNKMKASLQQCEELIDYCERKWK